MTGPSIEEFRTKVREWLAGHVPRLLPGESMFTASDKEVARDRAMQRSLWEGNIAGITVPVEYGGLGLTYEHEQVFREEAGGYRIPGVYWNAVNIAVPVLLAYGTEAQKRFHIPRILNGENIWCQLLSEPTGGSDLAGALTRAIRDGDEWVISGSKIWTSAGNYSSYGLCLARTDPDLPKHAGLTMFIVPMNSRGVTVQPIVMVNRDADFCQEFFEDVRVPAENVVGEVNGGWQVATTLLVSERTNTGRPMGPASGQDGIVLDRELLDLANAVGRGTDQRVLSLVGESWVLSEVQRLAARRVAKAIADGELPGTAASMLKALAGYTTLRKGEIVVEVAGLRAIGRKVSQPVNFGMRRVLSQNIGGGTTEMQLNVVAERLLGLPRDSSEDSRRPFSEIRHNVMPTRRKAIAATRDQEEP